MTDVRTCISERMSAKSAVGFLVIGDASIDISDDSQEARAGTWIHISANLKHSIKARTPVVMLLVLLK